MPKRTESVFSGKKVLITGGSGGLGSGLAKKFLQDGASVILLDINLEGLRAFKESFMNTAYYENIDTYKADFTKREEVLNICDLVLQKHGYIDVLINSAGVVTGKTILDSTFEEIERTFNINTISHFWTIKKFLPIMKEKNSGHIITISSAAGIIGVPKLADYCASKFAAFGIDESLRMELFKEKSKIKTTVVCPYYINTGMFKGVKTRFPFLLPILEPDKAVQKIYKGIKKGKTRIIFPALVYFTWFLRLFPTGFFDSVVHFLGIHDSMNDFIGRDTRQK